MRLPNRIAILALSVGLLACQVQPQLGLPSSKPVNPAVQTASKLDLPHPLKSAPSARVEVKPAANGKSRLVFSANYPATLSGFRTQALDCENFTGYQVSVQGIGISGPKYATGASLSEPYTVPAEGCSLTAEIPDIPSGSNRLAMLRAYDDNGELIPGSTLSAVFSMADEDQTVSLNYRHTPAGELVNQLLPQALANPELKLLLAQLDPMALQGFIDQLTGATDLNPTSFPLAHPALVNVPNILTDFIDEEGDIQALIANLQEPDHGYVLDGGTVSVNVTGLIREDEVRVFLTDPATGEVTLDLDDPNFSFEHVPPGTWKLVVDAPPGYSYSLMVDGQAVDEITVTEDQASDPVEIVLNWLPVVDELGPTSGTAGDTLVITGRNFYPDPEGNKVTIGGVEIPSENIQVNQDQTQLTVVLPANLPPGNQPVEVSVGGQAASTTPEFEVLESSDPLLNLSSNNVGTTSFDLSWNEVDGADSYNLYINGGSAISVSGTSLTVNDGDEAEINPATLYSVVIKAVIDNQEVNTASLDVFTASAWSNWGRIEETMNQNVLAVAASVKTPNKVYFGSKLASPSLGGIWTCELGEFDDCDRAVFDDEPDPGSVQAVAINPVNPNVIYAGSETNGVYRSTTGGDVDSWSTQNTGLSGDALNVRAIAIDPVHPDKVYIATKNGVWFRDFGVSGSSWENISQGIVSNATVNHLNAFSLSIYHPLTDPEPTVFVGVDAGGVYRKEGNNNWQTINTGIFSGASVSEGTTYLDGVTVTALAAHPTNSALLYGGGTGNYSSWKVGIWQRLNTDSSWTQIARNGTNGFPYLFLTPSTGLSSMQILSIAVDPVTPSTIYTATQKDGAQTGGIYYCTTGNTSCAANTTSWKKLGPTSGTTDTFFDSAQALAANQLHLYAGTPTGLYRAN